MDFRDGQTSMRKWKPHAGAAFSGLARARLRGAALCLLCAGPAWAQGPAGPQAAGRSADGADPSTVNLGPGGVKVERTGRSQVRVDQAQVVPGSRHEEVQEAQEAALPAQIWSMRRRPWIGTLAAGGVTLAASVVLGGVAFSRAQAFHDLEMAGGARADLLAVGSQARQLAFATDLLLGTTALFGLVTLVLRYGTGISAPPRPADLEPAYQVPGGELH